MCWLILRFFGVILMAEWMESMDVELLMGEWMNDNLWLKEWMEEWMECGCVGV